MSGDELTLIEEAFASNWIAPLGPHVDAFERETAVHTGRKAALALSSGTAGIHLAAVLLEIEAGDVVFCSSFTFAATIAPFYHLGAECVFIDSEPDSWNMSPQALARALETASAQRRLPKAVVVVNLYGQSCNMDPILALCRQYGIPLLEDAAESLGALYKGRPSGSFGAFSVFSYNGNKILTTSGGGMLLSDDPGQIDRARFLSTQARDPAPWYQHSILGWNYRLSNVLAAIGRAQMRHLQSRVEARRNIFKRYFEALKDVPGISFMPEPLWSRSTRWLTTLALRPPIRISPFEVLERMEARNIEGRPLWKPMHLQPVFAGGTYWPHEEGHDVSGELFSCGLCLPSGSSLSEPQQERVIECLKEVLEA
ncbi:MAG: DegT/DnrJ/EryC1/StrS family aminotransferase [Fretibacterium sp.]|nr:DegT/DnrJ/EryC1/StrS family aminotransferase [Fretibacterium sp.]